MTKILEINYCDECPYEKSERAYTGDSFETEFNWSCSHPSLAKPKHIYQVSWNEGKIEPPSWCPLEQSK